MNFYGLGQLDAFDKFAVSAGTAFRATAARGLQASALPQGTPARAIALDKTNRLGSMALARAHGEAVGLPPQAFGPNQVSKHRQTGAPVPSDGTYAQDGLGASRAQVAATGAAYQAKQPLPDLGQITPQDKYTMGTVTKPGQRLHPNHPNLR